MNRIRIAACALALAGSTSPLMAQMSANPPEIGRKIQQMGSELTRELVGTTNQLYAPLLAAASKEGVTVTKSVKYGPHERNTLDLYVPEKMAGVPAVMVFAHGGGFVRGDKGEVANIGNYFARRGIVMIAMNYRLSPDNKWPSGAEDVAGVVGWLKANATTHRGDVNRIFLAGNSAGAMHIAGYVFHEEYQVKDDGVAGAILISSPAVNLVGRQIDPDRDALYYGADPARHSAMSVINHVGGGKIPLFLSVGELDMPLVHDQNRQLIAALYERDKLLPNVKTALGHNHISIVAHIGTADESLGPDILEFVKAAR